MFYCELTCSPCCSWDPAWLDPAMLVDCPAPGSTSNLEPFYCAVRNGQVCSESYIPLL